MKEILEIVIKIISPLLPHISEELWEYLGKKGFVSVSKWPEREKINKRILKLEENLKSLIEDVKNIIKIAGKKKNCYLYAYSKEELEYLNDAKEFLKKILGFNNLTIFRASDRKKYDPQNKASKAKYGKPGIYLE
ncbi:MAG: class I tRNA ligase family protein [Candidatus Aenigmatarchaeota archaeon]